MKYSTINKNSGKAILSNTCVSKPMTRSPFIMLNLCVAVNLAATYVENVLIDVSRFPPAGSLPVLVDLTGMFLVGGIVKSFSRVMWAAVGSEARRAVGFIILGLLLSGSAATVLFALLDPEATRNSLQAVPRIVNLVLIAGAAAAAFRALAASRGLEGRRRTTVRWFAGFHLLAFITIVAGFFIPPSA